MRTVRDESGRRYLLLKQSSDSSRVRDPETGEERHVANDRLEPVDGESPLETASRAVPEPVRAVVGAVHDDRSLGLLLEIDARSPVDVRTLMGAVDLCESDLHGLLSEFRAAGLIAETDVAGVRGYETTERGRAGLSALVAAEDEG
ncbi:hypothetical protein ACFQMA_21810 [Halosimplex aquaticum]|uniref:Transcriptional regulator n=1 Tax=Halosimplex aquaticum TaxID=3026162 RepID=A0ABD5Y818_9EURY|nr:hypothetical protein [Halosimplex aquaticum]